jgi:hypothetical protein
MKPSATPLLPGTVSVNKAAESVRYETPSKAFQLLAAQDTNAVLTVNGGAKRVCVPKRAAFAHGQLRCAHNLTCNDRIYSNQPQLNWPRAPIKSAFAISFIAAYEIFLVTIRFPAGADGR